MRTPRPLALLLVVAAIITAIVVIQQVLPARARPAGPVASSVRPSDDGAPDRVPAPPVLGVTGWLNSQPLKLDELRGKVVLVDFWTYSCVNCLRTLPYLQQWYEKYADQGFTIIGVHTPEFEFEKNPDNVRRAVQELGVRWPVALDNDYATWDVYQNRYWPHKFLVDAEGQLRFHHIGEGAYEETEQWIRALLDEARLGAPAAPPVPAEGALEDQTEITRELYAGKAFASGSYVGNPAASTDGAIGLFKDPGTYDDGRVYFEGEWETAAEYMRAAGGPPDAWVALRYRAKSANAVLNTLEGSPVLVAVELDGKPVPAGLAGTDISYDAQGRSVVQMDAGRMYGLVNSPAIQDHVLRLIPLGPDLLLYTFTFSPT